MTTNIKIKNSPTNNSCINKDIILGHNSECKIVPIRNVTRIIELGNVSSRRIQRSSRNIDETIIIPINADTKTKRDVSNNKKTIGVEQTDTCYITHLGKKNWAIYPSPLLA